MAKVIDELLIGVSVDADEREFNEVQSGFDQIKSAALSLGAVIAGGLSLDSIIGKTNELAKEWDELAKETAAYEIDPILLQNLQHISESLGGAKEDAMGLLLNLRATQQGLQIGNLGYLEELAKITGADVIPLFQAGDEEDILKRLIALFSDMNSETRQAAFDAMGLTSGTRNLMMSGVQGYEDLINRSEELGNITSENTTKAERLQQAYTDAAKASDAAWQDFYGSLMDGASESLEYMTEKLVETRKKMEAQPDDIGLFRSYQKTGSAFVTSVLEDPIEDAKAWILDRIGPENWREDPFYSVEAYNKEMASRSTTEQTNNNQTNSRSTTNYNNITIQAGGMSESQVEGVVYKVINGAATQTEQDLKVNTQ